MTTIFIVRGQQHRRFFLSFGNALSIQLASCQEFFRSINYAGASFLCIKRKHNKTIERDGVFGDEISWQLALPAASLVSWDQRAYGVRDGTPRCRRQRRVSDTLKRKMVAILGKKTRLFCSQDCLKQSPAHAVVDSFAFSSWSEWNRVYSLVNSTLDDNKHARCVCLNTVGQAGRLRHRDVTS